MPRYANIDSDGKVIAVGDFGNIDLPNMIPVDASFRGKGKRWNGEDWEKYEPNPIPDSPLTEQEQITIDTALTVEYMACLLESNLG